MSFVKSAEVINNLKSYLSSRADKVVEIIAKVESHDSVPNLEEIVAASDAVMVARGDLGKHQPLSLCCIPYICLSQHFILIEKLSMRHIQTDRLLPCLM